ncbi:MAG TPA: hypothetical protein DEP05_06820 [Betaproteobacteria bacterium]|nr:hypothetical protein [Betaproteobacteria bacterium]
MAGASSLAIGFMSEGIRQKSEVKRAALPLGLIAANRDRGGGGLFRFLSFALCRPANSMEML